MVKGIDLPSSNYNWINFDKDKGTLHQNGVLNCHGGTGQVRFIVNDTRTIVFDYAKYFRNREQHS